MRNWSISSSETQNIAILLFPAFSNLCLANAVEPMRAANELLMREFYRWRFVTLDGEAVVSSSGLPVSPNARLRDHAGGDVLFVVSSYHVTDFANALTSRSLTAAAGRFDVVAGMDTGAWLMAHAGLLDGRRATIHWDEFTAFSEAYPAVEAEPERFVIDGDRITSGGAMTAFDLVLELIGRTHGEALRLEVSSIFLHQTTQAPQERVYRHHMSPVVERAIAVMTAALEKPLPIADIAVRVDITQRGLSRAFQSELGAPPITVYKRIRLAAARRYAQQSRYSIAEIALRCGYVNAAAMTRAFAQEYGKPPSAFRMQG